MGNNSCESLRNTRTVAHTHTHKENRKQKRIIFIITTSSTNKTSLNVILKVLTQTHKDRGWRRSKASKCRKPRWKRKKNEWVWERRTEWDKSMKDKIDKPCCIHWFEWFIKPLDIIWLEVFLFLALKKECTVYLSIYLSIYYMLCCVP